MIGTPVRIEAAARHAAGDTIAGRLLGAPEPAPLELLRVEREPHGDHVVAVAQATSAPSTGAFTLAIPGDALPTASGVRCGLAYRLQAPAAEATAVAEIEVAGTARAHLHPRVTRVDRLLAEWPGRHFHIELSDAVLQGGGRVAGRVHRHRSWAQGTLTVELRCVECWRTLEPALHSVPQWATKTLWQARERLDPDPDRTWAPFAFELPSALPPGMEARTIAWRYELLARRKAGRWLTETAAVTPLLYEEVPSPR